MVCCQNRVLNEIALVVGKCGFAKLMRQPENQNGAATARRQKSMLNRIVLAVGKCGFAKSLRQPETQFSVAKWSGGGSLPKECVEQGCVGC